VTIPETTPKLPHEHRFVIVAGKGGVGKSTISMALALAAAKAGRKTLLYQFGTQDSKTKTPFSEATVGEDIVEIRENLFAVRPSTESGMREYVLLKLKSKNAYRLVFENSFIKKLIDGIPGVNELIWLGKAFNHEREREHDGSPTWDTIVLDPPATGHSLYLFQVPFVIREAVQSGPFHREAVEMIELLTDPERTALHLVTLPEEMPVNECIQLKADVDARMGIPIKSLVVNGVFSDLFSESEVHALNTLRPQLEEDGGIIDRLVAAGLFRIERNKLQRSYITKLHNELGLPVIEMPQYFVPELDKEVLADMASRFLELPAAQSRETA